jgi:ribonuclease HI
MEQLDDNALNIYTDGACIPKPRRGGYAWLYVTTGEDGREVVQEYSPNGILGATNQEMELIACIEALKQAAGRHFPIDLSRFFKIVIYTDSQYVRDGFSTAKYQWSGNRYMRKSGPPVLNADLWKELIRLVKRLSMRVDIKWVPGKSNTYQAG